MCTIAQRFWLDPTTVGALPAAAAANQSPVIPPRPPYTQPGRITSPRTAFACNTSCSCAGRQATSLIESSGLVSSTSLSPVLPWTQTPLVKISVLGCDPRRPASIKASTAVLSLATALAEDTAFLGCIGVALRVPDDSDHGANLLARELRRLRRGTGQPVHVMTRPAERRRHGEAYEPGGTRHEHAHLTSSVTSLRTISPAPSARIRPHLQEPGYRTSTSSPHNAHAARWRASGLASRPCGLPWFATGEVPAWRNR